MSYIVAMSFQSNTLWISLQWLRFVCASDLLPRDGSLLFRNRRDFLDNST